MKTATIVMLGLGLMVQHWFLWNERQTNLRLEKSYESLYESFQSLHRSFDKEDIANQRLIVVNHELIAMIKRR